MCRRRVRRQILAWALMLLAGIAFLLFNGRYARNFVAGPYNLAPNELAQITDAETTPRYFVSVVGEKILDTGIQEVTTTTRNGVKEGSQVSAGYYALVVGDRFLIVKSAGKPPEKTAGELTPFPSDLSSQLFSGSDGRELQMHAYPFYLETEGFRYPGVLGHRKCLGTLRSFLEIPGDRHGYGTAVTSTTMPLSNDWSNGAIRSEYQSMSSERSTLQSDTSPTALSSPTITLCARRFFYLQHIALRRPVVDLQEGDTEICQFHPNWKVFRRDHDLLWRERNVFW